MPAAVWLQRLLPQHGLSRLAGRVARCQWGWLKNLLIRMFCRAYKVDMSDARQPDPRGYASFNAFFTRELRDGARAIAEGDSVLASPADGRMSQSGQIAEGRLLQAKGRWFGVGELLGSDELALEFAGGSFATVYLAPANYHRVHMPLGGMLRETRYIPGKLFSVSDATSRKVDRLFARNERLVCLFDCEAGPLAVVMVGALIVSGIETVWDEPILLGRAHARTIARSSVALAKGEEMGRFLVGSTVIVLCARTVSWAPERAQCGAKVEMGQALGFLSGTPEP